MSENSMPRPPRVSPRQAAAALIPTPPPRAAQAQLPLPHARQLATQPPRRFPQQDSLPYTPRRMASAPRAAVPPTRASSTASSSTSSSLASKARAALSSAASLAASTASSVASVAAATTSSEKRGAWEEWARDWRDGRKASINGKEVINILPGWAVKRPRKDDGQGTDAFDLHVSTTGFCTFVRDPSSISRTQRALMGIAKRFAALPALPNASQVANVIQDTVTDSPTQEKDLDLPIVSDSPPSHYNPRPTAKRQGSSASGMSGRGTSELAFSDPDQLSLAHEYLDLRLRPFWSSVLPYRRVALTMYTVPIKPGQPPPVPTAETYKQEPLMRTTFTTNAQGHWQHHFAIPWERICTHPPSVAMAFADDPARDRTDWGLVIRAELLAEEGPDSMKAATGEDASNVSPDRLVPRRMVGSNSFFSSNEIPGRNDGDGETEMGLMGLGRTTVESSVTVGISRPGGFRIISDLDDTVKHSDILSGPREVFRNVFCRRLEDICVPGMNDLYVKLTANGLSGLHFVSNSPFELFPMVADFFKLHRFPAYYSLKLKFYGGRSIVTSLFEPAGERKRPSIIEILDEFYDSRFILVGDSGEQDLELYSAIAHERPKQIAAVFIRDVTSGRLDELRALSAGFNKETADLYKPSLRTPSASGTSTPTTSVPTSSSDDDMKSTVAELQELSNDEEKLLKRAAQWDLRVTRAYDQVPPEIPLVFFREPEELESLSLELLRDADAKDEAKRGAKAG